MNDIAILHKAVNNNSNAGSTGMVFEGVVTEEDQIVLANENDVPIIVDAIKKGIYCSLHVIELTDSTKYEDYYGPITYNKKESGSESSFTLGYFDGAEIKRFYSSNTDPFVPNPSPEGPFEDPIS